MTFPLRHTLLCLGPIYRSGTPPLQWLSRSDHRWRIGSTLRQIWSTSQTKTAWMDALCINQDRHRTKYCRNLRFEPLFREGVGSAHLASLGSIHIHMNLFGLLRAGSGSSTIRGPFMILSQSLARLERTCYMDKSTARLKFHASH
jgi:hypothetical protein